MSARGNVFDFRNDPNDPCPDGTFCGGNHLMHISGDKNIIIEYNKYYNIHDDVVFPTTSYTGETSFLHNTIYRSDVFTSGEHSGGHIINLQYGTPVDILFKKYRHQKFEPAGFVKNVEEGALDKKALKIRTASSIVDYVAQFMLNNFSQSSGKIEFAVEQLEKTSDKQKALEDYGLDDGLVCPLCGGPAKRIGNCEILCTSCNQTTRNGCGD